MPRFKRQYSVVDDEGNVEGVYSEASDLPNPYDQARGTEAIVISEGGAPYSVERYIVVGGEMDMTTMTARRKEWARYEPARSAVAPSMPTSNPTPSTVPTSPDPIPAPTLTRLGPYTTVAAMMAASPAVNQTVGQTALVVGAETENLQTIFVVRLENNVKVWKMQSGAILALDWTSVTQTSSERIYDTGVGPGAYDYYGFSVRNVVSSDEPTQERRQRLQNLRPGEGTENRTDYLAGSLVSTGSSLTGLRTVFTFGGASLGFLTYRFTIGKGAGDVFYTSIFVVGSSGLAFPSSYEVKIRYLPID